MAAIAIVAASAFAAGQSTPKPAPQTAPQAAPQPSREPAVARPRETAVLAILARELDGRTATWFWSSRLVRERVGESERVVPQIPITCGNSKQGVVAEARARSLAGLLDAAFGPGAKLALEIDESRLPIMDGDTFTPLAAVAVDALTRLDALRDGEDVDVELLASKSLDVWPLPTARTDDGKVAAGVKAGGASQFDRGAKLHFEVRPDATGAGAAVRTDPIEVAGPIRPTFGHVALLFVPIYPTADLAGSGTPTLTIRVTQGGKLATATPATSSMVWLPSSFDAKQPFEIEGDLAPGFWTWGERVLATAPDE